MRSGVICVARLNPAIHKRDTCAREKGEASHRTAFSASGKLPARCLEGLTLSLAENAVSDTRSPQI